MTKTEAADLGPNKRDLVLTKRDIEKKGKNSGGWKGMNEKKKRDVRTNKVT